MNSHKLLISIIFFCQLTQIFPSIAQKVFPMDSSFSDVIYCGPETSHTIIGLTETSTVFRSEDKGVTWHIMSEEMHRSGQKELDENEHEVGKVSSLIPSPIDKNIIVFLGTHGVNWISQDCGKSVKALNHGRKIQEFHFHPTERTWGLASAYTICDDFKNGEPCLKFNELYVTKDLGENWELIKSYVEQFAWAAVDKFHIFRGVPKERILVTYEPRGKGHQKATGWNYKFDLISSDDFFKTYRLEVSKGNKFFVTPHYLFIAQAFDSAKQETRLLVSDSWLQRYDFKELDLNSSKFKEHSYSFLDTSESSVIINVNHFGQHSNYGNLYISDFKGVKFSSSLKYNVRDKTGNCEFDKIASLYGTYIANTYDKDVIEEHKQEIQSEAIEEENSIEEKKVDKNHQKKHSSTKDLENFIQTSITFNKGGKWHALKAPERDSLGKKYDCGDYCYLHLANTGSKYPPVYSVETAIGLVLGNGNVGKYLTDDDEEVATYLSRDGGLTWIEIKKGSHIYEFSDHGGLIILAENQKKSKSILYSWDEGLTWQDLQISEESVLIKNILTDPNSTSLEFIIYGDTETKKGKKGGFVVSLNFSNLNQPVCRNPQDPGTPNSDYEKWVPTDNLGEHKCHLGMKTFYTRRKRESQCFNPLKWEVRHFSELCACTDEDYECDVGYERTTNDSPCTAVHEISEIERNKPPEICNGHYEISRGYRRIPGNACRGGIQNDPLIVPCPHDYFGIWALLIILIVVAKVYFLYYFKDIIMENYVWPFISWFKSSDRIAMAGGYKKAPVDSTINFPDDDNVLFEDKEEQLNEVAEKAESKENEDISDDILIQKTVKPLKKLTR